MKIVLALFCGVIALSAFARDYKIERKDNLHGVTVETGKQDKVRMYRATFSRTVAAPLEVVRAGIINFEQKCNNSFATKRVWTAKNQKCAFKNENIVEVRAEKDLIQTLPDHSIYSRHGYNRGAFFYQELVTETKEVDSQNRPVLVIKQEMLSEKEAAKWVKQTIENTSAFKTMTGVFKLTALSANETQVDYTYSTETTHWLLNKEVTVPQVFAGMGQGLKDLWVSIEANATQGERHIASQH